MKILTVVGARPQFIKAAVVSHAIESWNGTEPIQEIILHTGQHYDHLMSNVFFEDMKLPRPQYYLGISGFTHGAMTGRMLEKIEEILIKENPDAVQVYGDTNSTLAGALAAAKLHIPIAHIEAGLRSFNMSMPEEINRILTDQISTWLFCPTEAAWKNIDAEGLSDRRGVQSVCVGDVMYDAARLYKKLARPSISIKSITSKLREGFYLATVHRAENTDNPKRLVSIMSALNKISVKKTVILPLHPRTRKNLNIQDFENVRIIDPVSYFDMIILLSTCDGVMTDSGGLQKEAYFFQKPCITLRDETEWIELIQAGVNVLAGADCAAIIAAEKYFFNIEHDFSQMLYGQGNAAEKIISHLL